MKLFPLVLLLCAGFAFAGAKSVAVFETLADRDSVVDDADRRYLTNELRKIALEELPKTRFSVMTRENIFQLIPPGKSLEECAEGQCLVELGRNVGAEYAAQGTVSKFGGQFTITVECYETMGGKLIGSFTSESETVNGLLAAMREKAPAMFEELLTDGEPQVEAPPPAPEPLLAPDPIPEPQTIATLIPQETQGQDKGSGLAWNQWVGIGLDILGAAALAMGFYQNREVASQLDAYNALPDGTATETFNQKWQTIEDAKKIRNMGYIAGGVLLAGGITFHLAF
jgi:hypothetical protein